MSALVYVARRMRRGLMAGATLLELGRVFVAGGRWFLVPLLIVLTLAALLLAVVHVLEYAAPFVYTVL